MKTIIAKDYNIIPNTQIEIPLNNLLKELIGDDEQKEILFEKGIYYFNADNCPKQVYYITNTISDDEYDSGETPSLRRIAVLIKDINNLIFNGNGASFVMQGMCTNIIIDNCNNITIKDLEILADNPNVHKFTVTKRTLFGIQIDISKQKYIYKNNTVYYVGKDYIFPINYSGKGSLAGTTFGDKDDYFKRVNNPFGKCDKITEKDGKIFVKGFFPKRRMKEGQQFYLFDSRRKEVGTFINHSKNVTLVDFKQRFNYSLGIVSQNSTNLTFDRLDCTPDPKSEIQYVSIADFIHLCCTRGKISITNSKFSTSCDDVLNVHGIHLKIQKVYGNTMQVKFCHPEAYGFNFIEVGDTIAIIGKNDLLEKENAKVIFSKLSDLHTIELTLDKNISEKYVGDVIENVTTNPDVLFENNYMTRIPTRGVLMTSRGKCLIQNNNFKFIYMNPIEVSDDALSWYESGMVKDLKVLNNIFGGTRRFEMVHILPCNIIHNGYVHSNIEIAGNTFVLDGNRYCYLLKSCQNISIHNNTYKTKNGYKKYLKPCIPMYKVDLVKKDF